ncbi:MAG TPA: glycine oxidase ThiO [Pyrinomonadaceae bacterium]|nr:glycine oxidase ThiO [Pyrinomonadaceae bacterium]
MLNGRHEGAAYDAVILGGGVVGLAAARELASRRLSVALVERGAVGRESSWAAGGMLAPQCEADAPDDFFRLACAARDRYPDFAAELREETGIDMELDETGTLYLATTEEDAREIGRRFDWQSRARLAVERLTADEARAVEPQVSPRALGALRFPRDWQVENRRLTEALRRGCELGGVRIHEHTPALSINAERGRVASVETGRGKIRAGAVVVACGAWSSQVPISTPGGGEGVGRRGVQIDNDAAAVRVEPVRGQMLSFETGGEPFVRHVIYGPRGYLVPRREGRLLAGSTSERAGFDKSVTEEGRASVAAHAAELAPAVAGLKLAEAWAGLRPRGEDDWPVVGESAEVENLFYATAHYRNGILLAPLTGALLADVIVNRTASPLLAPFSPTRLRRAATLGAG